MWLATGLSENGSLLSTLLLILIPATVMGQSDESDPCQPNPCGDNTRCLSTRVNENPVISCECNIGFEVPQGGDPFDGCVEKKSSTGTVMSTNKGNSILPSLNTDSSNPSTTTKSPIVQPLTTVAPPSNFDGSSPSGQTQGQEDDSGNRLQNGKRPSFLVPRRISQGEGSRPNDFKEVDTPDLFPEECLIHEDCEDTHFCSSPPENTCTEACTLDVCGQGAICIGKLHRPVCVCPDGYTGNPYDKCTETPSRVGMVFRK